MELLTKMKLVRKHPETLFMLLFVFITILLGIYVAVCFDSSSKNLKNISSVHSAVDFNHNGIDDYADFVKGARIDAQNHPEYDPAGVAGGYPPDNKGVCTDVVWRAFRQAGYSLKDMVDEDIKENVDLYPAVNRHPQPDIDFRRVRNLKVYFQRHAVCLPCDFSDSAKWQPGDIVIFNDEHIGILSDKRNIKGFPYLIHNGGQPQREENKLIYQGKVTGHYRFDASGLPSKDLIKFTS